MNLKEIQKMFSDMGLGTQEQRDKIAKELSINAVNHSFIEKENIKISNNTLKTEQYAQLARNIK